MHRSKLITALSSLLLTGSVIAQQFPSRLLSVDAADLSALTTDADSANYEEQFIFDPEGTEQLYCMSLYSYNQSGQRFVSATSLLSQVRFSPDGETVYFKDLYPSLGVATWVSGTIDGDTIRIPFGQPLAYYKGQYLVFFCPMEFNDATGDLTPLDELKFIQRGDSLLSPVYEEEGHFQGVCGYVIINDQKQGALSIDLDHGMRLLSERPVTPPTDVVPEEFIFTFDNSNGGIMKQKINVIQQADSLYIQLSTSAPKSYVKAVIDGDSLSLRGNQLVTDSTFVYFFSLADPVYRDDTLVDFTAVTDGNRLHWDAQARTISSAPDLFGVDYMDGGEVCMNYVTHLRLEPYAGDRISKPMAPRWASIDLVNSGYIAFYLTNLDVDSCYINPSGMSYRIYFDDEPYVFTHDTYLNIYEDIIEIPYGFAEGYDFWAYGQLHYVYVYEELFTTIGVQALYTVGDETRMSDIIMFNADTEESYTVASLTRPAIEENKASTHVYDLMGRRLSADHSGRGIFLRDGKIYTIH